MKMKIKYHKASEVGDFSREEIGALRYWHAVCGGALLVLLLSALLSCGSHNLELGNAAPVGFIHWFLLCMAYPVLGLLGLVNMLFSLQGTAFMRYVTQENQVGGVLIINFVTLLLIWGAVRFAGLRLLGAEKMRIGANFILILVCWGIFQLFLFGISSIWDDGGFSALHNKMKTEEPDKVIIVNPAAAPVAK